MKPKDIAIIVACIVVMGGAIFVGVKMFFPSKPAASTTTQTTETAKNQITGDINKSETKDTIDKLNALKNYGDTNLDNVGRVNPFAPLN